MTMERFDVRLSAEDAARVQADMRRRGVSKKAEHLRDCLRAGWAEQADGIAAGIGEIGMLLNDLIVILSETAAVPADMLEPLISEIMRMLCDLLKMINGKGRA